MAAEIAQIERELGEHGTAIENLERWQKQQNGTLLRLETKVDRLLYGVFTLMGMAILSLILLILRRG